LQVKAVIPCPDIFHVFVKIPLDNFFRIHSLIMIIIESTNALYKTDSACDTERIPNGKITGNCRAKIGERCRFECDRNFVNTTDVIVCQNDRKWSPAAPCTGETKCYFDCV
jgi:hypothetical protein